MKRFVLLVAGTMVLLIVAGCVTTIPLNTVPAVAKPKACR